MGPNRPVYVAGFERGVRPMGLWSISMILSMASSALERVVLAGLVAGAVEPLRERSIQDVRDQGRLARAGYPRDRREGRQRESDVDVLEVVRPDTLEPQRLAGPWTTLVRDGDRAFAAQERAGDRGPSGEQVLQGAAGDDLAAVLPSRGTDVDDPVRGPDGLLVVLHHDERVAQVAQSDEGRDELRVVLLVEPDGGLVEDVQDAHQAGADLGRQADALCLATRQGRAGPVDGQVVQPDVDQEAEPGADLLEHGAGDGLLPLAHPVQDRLRPAQGIRDGHAADVRDVSGRRW